MGQKAGVRIQETEGGNLENKGARIRKSGEPPIPPAKSFRDLLVWQKAHQFVLGVYKITQSSPVSETYGLVSQFRRAATSVPANIAEGFRKRGGPDKIRFLNIAQGSLEEARYYLILSRDLGYANVSVLENSAEKISRMLDGYSKSILSSASRLLNSPKGRSILSPDSRLLSPEETSHGHN